MKYLFYSIALMSMVLSALFLLVPEEEGKSTVVTATPLSVKTISATRTDYQVNVPAWGIVTPRETVEVRCQTAGQISEVAEGLYSGAFITQGMPLFTIDDRSYLIALKEAESATILARQALEIEKGRQIVARREWEFISSKTLQGDENPALALRQPQLREKEAALQIAAAKEMRARLELERTQITAPCDGVVLSESLMRGRLLDPGDAGAVIGCTDRLHILAHFSNRYLVDSSERKAQVLVDDMAFEGNVLTVLPQLDPKTRHRKALIELSGVKIPLGSHATLTLPGQSFENVVVLPRQALRTDDSVWVIDGKKTLQIRRVEVMAEDENSVIISQGIDSGQQIILSHIASPLAGMKLERLSGERDETQLAITIEE